MAKLTLNNLTSGFASTATLNANFDAIEAALENTLSRDGTTPNQMEADLDMNSNGILNLSSLDVASLLINGVPVTTPELNVSEVPAQATHTGKFLQTNGTVVSWQVPDAEEVTFDNGSTGSVSRVLGDKLRDGVSVKDFGAVGDGITDDTASLEAAIASGSTNIFFGDSTNIYLIDAISIPDGVSLSGNGATIKAKASNVNLLNVSGNNSINGLRIVNNNTTGCTGISFLENAVNVKISKNIFECESGFTMQAVSINELGVADVQVLENQMISVRYGFLSNANAEDFTRCVIANNVMKDIKADGVELNHPIHLTGLGTTPRPLPAYQSGRDIAITGNIIEGDSASDQTICLGIGIAGATNVTVTGNVVKNFRGRGIHIEDEARHISVIGNIIDTTVDNPLSTNSDGIHILGGQDIVVTGNTILNAAEEGIHCVAGAPYTDGEYATPRNVIITGNIIRGAGESGIKLSGSVSTYNNHYITHDNIITDCAGDGISILSSANRISLKDNRIFSNSGYAIAITGIHPGIEFADNFTESNTAGRYSVTSPIMPIPSKGESTLFTAVADGAGTTPATTAFNLGKGASGIMTVIGRTTDGAATGMRTYNVLWDGTTLTISTAYSYIVTMGFATPTMSGTSIQVSATSAGAGKTVLFDVKFEGTIALF